MFDKIFSEYSMLAICVIAGIAIIFHKYYPTLMEFGQHLTDFVNSYNN